MFTDVYVVCEGGWVGGWEEDSLCRGREGGWEEVGWRVAEAETCGEVGGRMKSVLARHAPASPWLGCHQLQPHERRTSSFIR